MPVLFILGLTTSRFANLLVPRQHTTKNHFKKELLRVISAPPLLEGCGLDSDIWCPCEHSPMAWRWWLRLPAPCSGHTTQRGKLLPSVSHLPPSFFVIVSSSPAHVALFIQQQHQHHEIPYSPNYPIPTSLLYPCTLRRGSFLPLMLCMYI